MCCASIWAQLTADVTHISVRISVPVTVNSLFSYSLSASFFTVFPNGAILLFILLFSHVSWQPPNIQRSPSDFFYPKSLIRRTGRSPALQVGAV